VVVPNSSMFGGPFWPNSARKALEMPTFEITPAKRSGLSVSARPTVMPPAEPPEMVSVALEAQPSRMRCSQQSMRSRQVFGLVSFCPPFHQRLPYSPPPRTWAVAKTPSRSSRASVRGLK
jgi:hypothetical protein